MSDGIILQGKPKPTDHITVEHPIFTEIGEAFAELFQRTTIIAATVAGIADVLKDAGLIEVPDEEELPDIGPSDAEPFLHD